MEDKKIIELLFVRAENAIAELGRTMDRFLDTKFKESRYIFVRRYWFGDSVAEIAKELKLKENAVYVRLNRIRNSLKEYLLKEGYHYEA